MDLDLVKQKMHKALDVLKNDLASVRTGRAAPSLVENISVLVYGGSTRLKVMELATIGASDQHALIVTPFDGSIIGEIQKGITDANTGLTPVIDGQVIRIAIPPLSEERRKELIHLMNQKLENGKVMLRQIRHEAMNDLRKDGFSEDEKRRLEKEIQNLTDNVIADIESLGKHKEGELLQI